MNALRSVIFNFLYVFGSLFCSLILLWALFLPERKCTEIISTVYGGFINLVEKYAMGLKLEMKGLEHLPKGGAFIIAAKHQSAFETLKLPFMKILGYPVIVLKKELTRLPLWGFYPRRMGLIAIDRGRGMESMTEMAKGCRKAIDSGRPVAIFPQGTRVKPGRVAPYKAGLAKMYKELNVPVVPMALNSGVFWGRNAFFKKAGTVTFQFLPPIPPGLPPLQMMEELEKILEAESDKLVQQAGGAALGTVA